MAPSLRSSAPNTPTGKSSGGSEASTVTPRKTPTCTKCKRPRAGHPRSGCPFTDSPSKDHTAQTPPATAAGNLTDALGSMHIQSPPGGRDEETKATIRNRRRSSQPLAATQTLLSLSSESQEIVERLLQPGMFDDTDDDHIPDSKGAKTRVVRWQETLLETPSKPKPRIKMPGSLSTPSPGSSLASTQFVPEKTDMSPMLGHPSVANLSSNPGSLPPRPQPLVRSMSLEERDIFVSSLTKASDATVYVVPSDEIHNIQASAIKLGFHTRIMVNKDKHDPQGLLVLGQDEAAVRQLYERVEVERKKVSPGRLGAVAGGAMVGVVGAWAGLAFT